MVRGSLCSPMAFCICMQTPSLVTGGPVGQWVKRWPAVLVFPSSIPVGGNLFDRKQGSIAHNLSLSPSYRPDMTEMLLKKT